MTATGVDEAHSGLAANSLYVHVPWHSSPASSSGTLGAGETWPATADSIGRDPTTRLPDQPTQPKTPRVTSQVLGLWPPPDDTGRHLGPDGSRGFEAGETARSAAAATRPPLADKSLGAYIINPIKFIRYILLFYIIYI